MQYKLLDEQIEKTIEILKQYETFYVFNKLEFEEKCTGNDQDKTR